MTPVRTARSNTVYRGPSPDILDAWVEATDDTAFLVWELTDEERADIAAGANLRLGVHQHPMPPVSLETTQELALTSLGEMWHERARSAIRPLSVGPLDIPAGHWIASLDVWRDLQRHGALGASSDGVPVLWGRPVATVDYLGEDVLRFVPAVWGHDDA